MNTKFFFSCSTALRNSKWLTGTCLFSFSPFHNSYLFYYMCTLGNGKELGNRRYVLNT